MIDRQVPEWVIIDEVQKIPKLLDIVHLEIERRNTKFALTGSSARKLKRGAANLLAGRAFVYQLYPFTHLELGDAFDLALALQWGALPRILSCSSDEDRTLFLESYVESYLRVARRKFQNLLCF
jgi:predicted AAA+ superfamily ATPase